MTEDIAERTRIAAQALREAAEEVERRCESAIADQHGGYVDGYRAASEAIAKMLREEALPRFPHHYQPSDACFVCGDPADHRRHRVGGLDSASPAALRPDQMGCAICHTEVVWDPDDPTGQQPRWRHVDQGASYRSVAGAHRALPNPTRRLRACVEVWPGCYSGGYDPSCCRFPKSCSATVYDPEHVDDDQLEDR